MKFQPEPILEADPHYCGGCVSCLTRTILVKDERIRQLEARLTPTVDTGDCTTCSFLLSGGYCRLGNDTSRASCCFHSRAGENDKAKQREQHIRNLEDENARLKAELADWRAAAETAAKEDCGQEKHCTCVPLLRQIVQNVKAFTAGVNPCVNGRIIPRDMVIPSAMVTIESRRWDGKQRWAICCGGFCLSKSGKEFVTIAVKSR